MSGPRMDTVTTEPAAPCAAWCAGGHAPDELCVGASSEVPISGRPLAWLTQHPDRRPRLVLDVTSALELPLQEADALGAFLRNIAQETR